MKKTTIYCTNSNEDSFDLISDLDNENDYNSSLSKNLIFSISESKGKKFILKCCFSQKLPNNNLKCKYTNYLNHYQKYHYTTYKFLHIGHL